MKKRVLCIILALLMVFPLVFAAFADTETGSRDRGSVSLSKTSDVEAFVKETPAAKETPGASDPVEMMEAVDSPDQLRETQLTSSENDPKNRPRLLINMQDYEKYNQEHNTSIQLENWGSPSDGVFDLGLDYQSRDVVVFAPYDHVPGYEDWYDDYDDPSTARFFDEEFYNSCPALGQRIADTIGGNCYFFTQSNVTPARIAHALEKCKVVFYIGHGITFNSPAEDWLDPTGHTSDYPTSYLCMMDQNYVQYGINGTDIAAYMGAADNKPFFWMGGCQTMKSDSLCQPLLKKGVEVVFGYTDSFWNDHDDDCRNYFWTEMLKGKTVEEASPAFYAALEGLPDHVVYEGEEHGDAYPLIVSSVDPYPTTPLLLNHWYLPKSQWTLFDGNPDDLPTSFIPNNPIAPEDAEYLTSYYYNVGGTNPDYESRNLKFLRFEWDSSGDTAYAVYVSERDYEDLQAINNAGCDSYYTSDENYLYRCKVEAAIVQEGDLKYAVVHEDKSPSRDDRTNGIRRAEYCKYAPYMYEKGWVFDHWRFKKNNESASNSDPDAWDAWTVYYNKWTGGETERKATHKKLNGEKVVIVEKSDAPDGIKRSVIPGESYCSHFWVYDGVEWETKLFDPLTEKGAKAKFMFHCAHGCENTKEKPLIITADAEVTGKRHNTDGTYEFAFAASLSGKDRNLSKDHWDHYERTTIQYGDDQTASPTATSSATATPTPTPTPTPTHPADHTPSWEFDGFVWEAEYSCDGYDEPDGSENRAPAYIRIPKSNTVSAKAAYHCTECPAQTSKPVDVDDIVKDGVFLQGIYLHEAGAYLASIYSDYDHLYHEEITVLGSGYPAWFFQGFKWVTANGEKKAYAVYHYGDRFGNATSDADPEDIETMKEYDRKGWNRWDLYVHYYDVQIEVPAQVSPVNSVTIMEKYRATISAEESPNGYSYSSTQNFAPSFNPKLPSTERLKPFKPFDPVPGPIRPIKPINW